MKTKRTEKGIYMIVDDVNDKKFIGYSFNVFAAFKNLYLNSKNSKCPSLFADMRKNTLASFSFKVLLSDIRLKQSQLITLTNTFIRYFNTIDNGYNEGYLNDSFYDFDLKGKSPEDILKFVLSQED